MPLLTESYVYDVITKAKILYAMRLFRDAVKLAHHLIREGYEWKEANRRLIGG